MSPLVLFRCFSLISELVGWSGPFISSSFSVSLSEEKRFCNDHHICHVAIVQRINASAAIFLMVSASQCSLLSSDEASKGNAALCERNRHTYLNLNVSSGSPNRSNYHNTTIHYHNHTTSDLCTNVRKTNSCVFIVPR